MHRVKITGVASLLLRVLGGGGYRLTDEKTWREQKLRNTPGRPSCFSLIRDSCRIYQATTMPWWERSKGGSNTIPTFKEFSYVISKMKGLAPGRSPALPQDCAARTNVPHKHRRSVGGGVLEKAFFFLMCVGLSGAPRSVLSSLMTQTIAQECFPEQLVHAEWLLWWAAPQRVQVRFPGTSWESSQARFQRDFL